MTKQRRIISQYRSFMRKQAFNWRRFRAWGWPDMASLAIKRAAHWRDRARAFE